MKSLIPTVVLGLLASASFADGDFGTREDAKRLADAMIEIASNEGVGAAISAMHDPDLPFLNSRMGINLFSNSIVIADNREPEMLAMDFAATEDLTGTLVWPIIAEAARVEGDAALRWYHYDTQEHYDYKCHAKAFAPFDVTVMVCR